LLHRKTCTTGQIVGPLERDTYMKKNWENTESPNALTATRTMPHEARVPAELRIGGVRIAPATVLAPMAGVTDTVFRRFIKNASMFAQPEAAPPELTSAVDVDAETTNEVSGCGLIMTEFTSADGLSRMRETKRTLPHLLRGRASDLGATLRVESGHAGRLRTHLPGRGLRSRRSESRLPGQARRLLQRRQRPAARPATHPRDLRGDPQGRLDSLHREVPHGLERHQHRLRGAGKDG
jgi:hypothetical protein